MRTRERTIEIGPRAGERFAVGTPSHATEAMVLAGGVTANLAASFETNGQYVCVLEVHWTDGVISSPDPNGFDGPLRMRRGRDGWQDVPFAARGDRDTRGSASTSSPRRSPPIGRSAPREASACMSSTSPAAS
jgi:predicted dehydrogenase